MPERLPLRELLQGRRSRAVQLGALVGLALFLCVRGATWLTHGELVANLVNHADHSIYMAAADRIRAGGSIYPAWQLGQSFGLEMNPELYPPTTLLGLILPMSLLPPIFWWSIPLSIVAAHVMLSRPSLTGWILILVCLAMPRSWIAIASGGLVLWAAAALSLGVRFGWAAAAVLLKPTLAPFALVGAGRRGWWFVLSVGVIASIAMLPAWLDYLTVLRNFHDPRGLLYSVEEFPLMLIPLIAWRSRSYRPGPVTRRSFGRALLHPGVLNRRLTVEPVRIRASD